jgi:hypothetical protein
MKNIYEVLRQKELEVQQLQKDIEALRVAARLLADDSEAETKVSSGPQPMRTTVPPATTTPRAAEAGYSASSSAGVRQFP